MKPLGLSNTKLFTFSNGQLGIPNAFCFAKTDNIINQMRFCINGGTHSYHPFWIGILSEINHPCLGTLIFRKPPFLRAAAVQSQWSVSRNARPLANVSSIEADQAVAGFIEFLVKKMGKP